MEFWENIKGWIGSDIFSIFVYVAIAALFLTGVLKCIVPVVRTRDLLERAIKNIKKGDKAKRSWQDDRFLGRGTLMPHWADYLNNLFFADNEYHNPANVEDYINEETVISGPGRAQLAEALPGVQVSLGFLGTLMGLSVALSGMSAEAADVAVSMSTLLSSMKYAFLTSIVGVVASVSFTLITRAVQGSAQRTLIEFYNAMARYAGVLSVDPMTQIAIYQQEQTGLMKQLLEKVNTENLADRVAETFAPLTDEIRASMTMVSQQQEKLMDSVAEAYIRRMDEAVHGQLDHLANTIDQTCRAQEKTIKNVSDALLTFGDAARAMRDIKQHSTELLEKYENVLARISQAQSSNEASARQTDRILAQQNENMGALAELNQEFRRQIADMENATQNFMNAMEQRNEEYGRIAQETLAGMGSATESLSVVMSDARKKLNREMSESVRYFEDCMTQILKQIEWAANAVKDSVSALPEAVQNASGEYLSEIQQLSDALRASRKKLNGTVKKDGGNE